MHRRTALSLTIALAAAAAFAAGVVVDRYVRPAPDGRALPDSGSILSHVHSAHETLYVCPMHPQVVSEKPGTCPICGMALVPVQQTSEQPGNADDARPTVRIAPEVVESLGVKLARANRTTLVRRIETPGFVQQIEPTQHVRVQAPFAGRIAALHVRSGQWIASGKPLATLESEALLAAESAHVALLKESAPSEESRAQLSRLGLSDDAIRTLEQKRAPSSKLTLYAPYPGRITNLRAAAGDAVTSGAALFELSGMARASVLANAFQRDAAWIRNGAPVEVRLPHASSQSWPGVVNQGVVAIDPNSQNIGVRLSFTAPADLLVSGMYVVATIHGDSHPGVLAVPQEALIRTESEDRVIVALGGGRFKPVRVQTGIETGGLAEIVSGLNPGDEVVVSAQFLIDSESSLRASFERMTAH